MSTLNTDERQALSLMRQTVTRRSFTNSVAESYYDGSFSVKNLGIAVPSTMEDIGTVSDWPSTVVDIHHERMQFQGWIDQGRTNIRELYQATDAGLKVSEAMLDSLIYGVGFVAVAVDESGDPRLHTVSPRAGSMLWDYANDRAIAGYREVATRDGSVRTYLMVPGQIITLDDDDNVDNRQHLPMLGDVVPMVRLRNRLRPRRFTGQSEITPAVRYYTDAAVRTMLGMEINREFYTTPQRYALNADMSLFGYEEGMSESARIEAGWKVQAGKMLGIPPPDPGDPEPRIGQFTPAPPTPYVEQLRTYSQLLAAASGVPSAYLGFSTETPPSGDAIRAWSERLIRAVEAKEEIARADIHLLGWILHRIGAAGEALSLSEWSEIEEKWRDPATPTKAADTDAAVKLVAAQILDAESSVTWDRVGLSQSEQRRMVRERDQTRVSELVSAIRERSLTGESLALSERKGDEPPEEAPDRPGGEVQ